MPIASSINKSIRYKVEATFGTAPGTSGAQLLRRVDSSLDLSKDTYQSNEIRTDYQIADFRHGMRKVGGNIKGELSPKTYADFMAAALRRDFAAITAITGVSVTIAGSGPTWTVTRGAGDYIAGGLKVGHVVRLSVGTLNAANINKNLLITALTTTVMTVMPLNGVALVAEGPIASTTVTAVGKVTFTPTTGHTDKSYSIEHWYNDIAQSELFTGCKVGSIDLNLPPSGMATIDMSLIGQGLTTGTAQYYTSPTALTTTGVTAAVNGVLLVNGAAVAIVTGLSIKIDTGNQAMDGVVGSNVIPGIAAGSIKVTGQFSAYFQDATMRDYFINETAISLVAAFSCDNTATSDFIAFTLPNLKVGSATKRDSDKGIVASYDFTALFNSAGGAAVSSEQTTLVVQDSQA